MEGEQVDPISEAKVPLAPEITTAVSSPRPWRLDLLWTWRWKPTSQQDLERSEKMMLEGCGVHYEQQMVEISPGVYVNTLKCGSGPPLLLVHGFLASIGFWVANLKELSKHHTVYAIDMVGFGRSSRPPFRGGAEEADKYFVESIEAWRLKMGLEKFTIMGHSFGAYVSCLYSAQYPNVEHLILADPWGVPSRPDKDTRPIPWKWRMLVKLLSWFTPLAGVRAAGPYGPGLIARFRSDINAKFTYMYNDQRVTDYIYHSNAVTPTGEHAFGALTVPIGWARKPLLTRNLAETLDPKMPVTMLYGEHSWMDPSQGRLLKQQLGDRAQFLLLQDCGHHIYVDDYMEFNRLVIAASNRVQKSLSSRT